MACVDEGNLNRLIEKEGASATLTLEFAAYMN